jgi:hypothetical protein
MTLTPMRAGIAISLVIINGILSVLLAIIGVFGMGFGGEMGTLDTLFYSCLFFFPFPICLIALGSLRWATVLIWINLFGLYLGNFFRDGTYFNPFDNFVSALSVLVMLLTTSAFLVVSAGRWRGNSGLLKLVRSQYADANEESK